MQKIRVSGEYNMDEKDKKLLYRDEIKEVTWEFLEILQMHLNSIVQN